MTSTTVFYIIIMILIVKFLFDRLLSYLNAKHFKDPVPDELGDVYNEGEYLKSQQYKLTNHRFSVYTSSFSIVITLAFFFLDGFAVVDTISKEITSNQILITLLFFGIIVLANEIISIPLSYYKTFVIEEKFGFNKSTKMLFWKDKIKGLIMMTIIGGGLLALIVWFYQVTGSNFWIYTWMIITLFSIIMNMFYAKLIVPLFNKQTALEPGELKNEIEKFAQKVGFKINNIYVIDGSKRSTKANAYFSGFGSQKRITLYDTLIKDLQTEEIVAVLAHEVGHYKRKHIIFNMILSVISTGFTLYLLSLFVDNLLLSNALGVATPSFHIGLIAFGILYSPISELTGLLMNIVSRKFEYQADNFAKQYYAAEHLINSLKKLSKNSLSNLTPHKWSVLWHYSHPTLLQRILNLKN